MPTPRSPRAMALSIVPSLISTDPDCASRRKTSPVATPSERSASSAVSTVASFVSRSLISAQSLPSAETRSRLAVSLLADQPLVARSFQLNLCLRQRHAQDWWSRSSRINRSSLAHFSSISAFGRDTLKTGGLAPRGSTARRSLISAQSLPSAETRSRLVVSLLADQPLVARSSQLNLCLRQRHAQDWWSRSSRINRSSLAHLSSISAFGRDTLKTGGLAPRRQG